MEFYEVVKSLGDEVQYKGRLIALADANHHLSIPPSLPHTQHLHYLTYLGLGNHDVLVRIPPLP